MEETYRILLDERWALEDLYTFPHAYSQTYTLVYCFDTSLELRDEERINVALESHPWKGGYSYVNIYTVLKTQVPVEQRPIIKSIQLASPGWLDLLMNPDVALKVAESVGILLGLAVTATKTYRLIYKDLSEINNQRKKNNAEIIQLSKAEIEHLMQMSDELASHLGFGSVAELHERTKNPELSLKILMAHYRRLKILGTYVKNGKVKLLKNG